MSEAAQKNRSRRCKPVGMLARYMLACRGWIPVLDYFIVFSFEFFPII